MSNVCGAVPILCPRIAGSPAMQSLREGIR